MIVHIMQPTIRAYYRLEEIWGDKEIKLGAAKRVATASKNAGSVVVKKPSRHLTTSQPEAVAIIEKAPRSAAKKVVAKKAAAKTVGAKKAATKKTIPKNTIKIALKTPAKKTTSSKTPAAKKPRVSAAKTPVRRSAAKTSVK
jgi:ribosome-associated protein